jgi:hypothetical protein
MNMPAQYFNNHMNVYKMYMTLYSLFVIKNHSLNTHVLIIATVIQVSYLKLHFHKQNIRVMLFAETNKYVYTYE